MISCNPVVLIHGIDETLTTFDRLGPFLEKRGWAVHGFDLAPNNGDAALEKLAGQLACYTRGIFPGEQVFDIVAFSMGGLVARYFLQRMSGLKRVRRLITISTPHRGTCTAFFRWNTGARQMRPGSEFLQNLNADVQILTRIPFVSIWSPLDLMIVPAISSAIPAARSVRVSVPVHALMLRDRRVLRCVEEALIS
jgi:triacylglycerol lipase